MKFNLKVTIPEHVEDCTHGTIIHQEVKVVCRRSDGIVSLSQGYEIIVMEEKQAERLYHHLKSVFGD